MWTALSISASGSKGVSAGKAPIEIIAIITAILMFSSAAGYVFPNTYVYLTASVA